MDQHSVDIQLMTRALELARCGQGHVEPNPMVGAVIAQGSRIVGEGAHREHGQAHAEVEAIAAAGSAARDATLYVTLEPCCHTGKTPPCTGAIIRAGLSRVVAACRDPFPIVDGEGITQLREAEIQVEVGLLKDQALALNAPFIKLIEKSSPWIIAKWAMTLDGKIATRSGDSRWISGDASRAVVHQLRGRVDAILIGSGTALADDPLLTARPAGPRIADRIVLDSTASLPVTHKLAQTAREIPTWIVTGPDASQENSQRLAECGCEVYMCCSDDRQQRLEELLAELAGRRITNLLVEGGSRLLGSLMDLGQIDEVHAFISPKLIGGDKAFTPIAGSGVETIADAIHLDNRTVDFLGDDIHIHGRVRPVMQHACGSQRNR